MLRASEHILRDQWRKDRPVGQYLNIVRQLVDHAEDECDRCKVMLLHAGYSSEDIRKVRQGEEWP